MSEATNAVFNWLQKAGKRMTNKEIQAALNMPRRTVYAALSTLEVEGKIVRRPSLRDTRQVYSWVP